MWNPFRRNKTEEPVEAPVEIEETPAEPTRRERVITATVHGLRRAGSAIGGGAKVVGGRAADFGSDAGSAITQFRCARLARKLQRNQALADAAREALND